MSLAYIYECTDGTRNYNKQLSDYLHIDNLEA